MVFGIERGRDVWSMRDLAMVRGRLFLFLVNDTRGVIGSTGWGQIGTGRTLELLVLDKSKVEKGCTFHDWSLLSFELSLKSRQRNCCHKQIESR